MSIKKSGHLTQHTERTEKYPTCQWNDSAPRLWAL